MIVQDKSLMTLKNKNWVSFNSVIYLFWIFSNPNRLENMHTLLNLLLNGADCSMMSFNSQGQLTSR